jgi:hypothetical protein
LHCIVVNSRETVNRPFIDSENVTNGAVTSSSIMGSYDKSVYRTICLTVNMVEFHVFFDQFNP